MSTLNDHLAFVAFTSLLETSYVWILFLFYITVGLQVQPNVHLQIAWQSRC